MASFNHSLVLIELLEFVSDFWDVLFDMKPEMQKRFLRFVTGSDRVPVGGMAEMSFKITRIRDRPDNLPEAHTCFNQLVLPDYPDKERLYQKLTIALSNAEGSVHHFSLSTIYLRYSKYVAGIKTSRSLYFKNHSLILIIPSNTSLCYALSSFI